jgi:NDP-sugar pyrophosphorylase family protein
LTDGDIRRWILRGGGLDYSVENVCNKNAYFYTAEVAVDKVKRDMLERKITCIPIITEQREVKDFYLWEEVFGDKVHRKKLPTLHIPVVIMAGGQGTRLDPFTRILPKPLIPIGDKTIIEIIIDKFREYQIDHFYISVNHKSKILKSYFDELSPQYSIEYINEDKPLGTSGSLKFLQGKLDTPFFVTNCDIIVEADYGELLAFHQEKKNDITLVASMKHFNIPYGICEIENGGALTKIVEKPEYSFLVNTGMYVLEPSVLKHIPENVLFHITDLIDRVRTTGGKIGVFPISEKSWIDTGEWSEYKRALELLTH